ncbi:hypothetical protein C7S20_19130 [Christiangramia fulva]|uniref:Uncharacterized protein n=1 Tax=Christiangramia fulva TaxID=2126553 RepID=A0A2R3ZAK1_9FLAO|nr:hypothetical protein [Christiangramia fulva]AVR47192.1 hypothetical protein C7S20_19130 [Christiangramia fulva]
MNYIAHLNKVLAHFGRDPRLHPPHISLYMALFKKWNEEHFPRWLTISRKLVMKDACMGSKSNYHRCIKDMHRWGYLKYKPSHAMAGSRVRLLLDLKIGVPLEGQPDDQACLLLGHRCPHTGLLSIYNKHINIKRLWKEKKEAIEAFFKRKNLENAPEEFLRWVSLDYPEKETFDNVEDLLEEWFQEMKVEHALKSSTDEDYLKVKKVKRYDQPL